MRYDTPIYFVYIAKGEYDTKTGNWNEDESREVCVMANVTNTGIDTLGLVYGNVKQQSLTVRVQNNYDLSDYIRIGSKSYRIDHSRTLRRTQTFIVSEVQ